MGHRRASDPALTAFRATLFGSYASSVIVVAINSFLTYALTQPKPTFPIPTPLSIPLALGAIQLFAGCVGFMVYYTKSPKKFYIVVALCDFLLFEAYTYTAVGTFGVMNSVGCAGLAKAGDNGLVGELMGVKGREGFGLADLMAMDYSTCAEVKASWAFLVIGGIINLLAAVAAYFMHDRRGSMQRGGGGGGYGGGGYGGGYARY
ncbi:hypothetical protein N0V82_007970 [Gnomoniopsis sp. IMI 355080]|nr:hypothetical protein N0V82_007970 [Gnomoniopsis sp. IMI 355080]